MKKNVLIGLLTTIVCFVGITIFTMWNHDSYVFVDKAGSIPYVSEDISFLESWKLKAVEDGNFTLNKTEFSAVNNSAKVIYKKLRFNKNIVSARNLEDFTYLVNDDQTDEFTKYEVTNNKVTNFDRSKEIVYSYVDETTIFVVNDFYVNNKNYRASIYDSLTNTVIGKEEVYQLKDSDRITIKGHKNMDFSVEELNYWIKPYYTTVKKAVANEEVTLAVVEEINIPEVEKVGEQPSIITYINNTPTTTVVEVDAKLDNFSVKADDTKAEVTLNWKISPGTKPVDKIDIVLDDKVIDIISGDKTTYKIYDKQGAHDYKIVAHYGTKTLDSQAIAATLSKDIYATTYTLENTDETMSVKDVVVSGRYIGKLTQGKALITNPIIGVVTKINLTSTQIDELNSGKLLTPVTFTGLSGDTNYNISFEFVDSTQPNKVVTVDYANKISSYTDYIPPTIKDMKVDKAIYNKGENINGTVTLATNPSSVTITKMTIDGVDRVMTKVSNTVYTYTGAAPITFGAKQTILNQVCYDSSSSAGVTEKCITPTATVSASYNVIKDVPVITTSNSKPGLTNEDFTVSVTDTDAALDVNSIVVEVYNGSTLVTTTSVTGPFPKNVNILGLSENTTYTFKTKATYNILDGLPHTDVEMNSFNATTLKITPSATITVTGQTSNTITTTINVSDENSAIDKATLKVEAIEKVTGLSAGTVSAFDANEAFPQTVTFYVAPGRYELRVVTDFNVGDGVAHMGVKIGSVNTQTTTTLVIYDTDTSATKIDPNTYIVPNNDVVIEGSDDTSQSVKVSYTGYGSSTDFNTWKYLSNVKKLTLSNPGVYTITSTNPVTINNYIINPGSLSPTTIKFYVLTSYDTTVNNGSYGISTAPEFKIFNDINSRYPVANIHLLNDIDMTSTPNVTIRRTYSGIFDGRGNNITNWNSTRGGLFRNLSNRVQNLYLIGNGNMTIAPNVDESIGLIANVTSGNTVISNVGVTGFNLIDTISSNTLLSGTGGLVGKSSGSSITITNSYYKGAISSTKNNDSGVGGLIGTVLYGTSSITNSYVNADLTAAITTTNPTVIIGGIVGIVENTREHSVSNSYFNGSLNSPSTGAYAIEAGGIYGRSKGTLTITNSYSYIDAADINTAPYEYKDAIVGKNYGTAATVNNFAFYNGIFPISSNVTGTPTIWTTPSITAVQMNAILDEFKYGPIIDNNLPKLLDSDGVLMKHQGTYTYN